MDTSPKLGLPVYYEDETGTIYPAVITHMYTEHSGSERAPCNVDLFVMGRTHSFNVWDVPVGTFGELYRGKWFNIL